MASVYLAQIEARELRLEKAPGYREGIAGPPVIDSFCVGDSCPRDAQGQSVSQLSSYDMGVIATIVISLLLVGLNIVLHIRHLSRLSSDSVATC